jgi:hypothetical protein
VIAKFEKNPELHTYFQELIWIHTKQGYYDNNPEGQLELEKAPIDDEVARKILKIKEPYHLDY